MVQVFLDFWVEYTEEEQLNSRLNTSYSASVPRRVSSQLNLPFNPASIYIEFHLQQSIHSGEHIRLVRAFIKTLHEFANSATGDKSAKDELKRYIYIYW